MAHCFLLFPKQLSKARIMTIPNVFHLQMSFLLEHLAFGYDELEFLHTKKRWKTWYHLRDVNCAKNWSFIMCFHVIFMHFYLCLRMKNIVQCILDFLCFHAWELKGFFCFHFCNLLASNVGDQTILNGNLYLQPLSLLIYFGLCDPLPLLYCNQVGIGLCDYFFGLKHIWLVAKCTTISKTWFL